jgi:hypothetical protein
LVSSGSATASKLSSKAGIAKQQSSRTTKNKRPAVVSERQSRESNNNNDAASNYNRHFRLSDDSDSGKDEANYPPNKSNVMTKQQRPPSARSKKPGKLSGRRRGESSS